MKRVIRRMAAGLCAALLGIALPACAQQENPPQTSAQQQTATVPEAMGGYVEEDISPDTNFNVGLYAIGDTLHAITIENPADPLDQQVAHWYIRGQDGAWTENPDNGFQAAAAQVSQKDYASCSAYVTQDGVLYWCIVTVSDDVDRTAEQSIFRVQDGKAEKLDTLPAGELSLEYSGAVNDLAVCGDTIIAATTSAALRAYDLQGNPVTCELPDIGYGRLIGGNSHGFYLLDSSDQIQHYLVGGTTAETVLDGGMFSLTSADLSVQKGVAGSDDTLYIQMSSMNLADKRNTLYAYRWDDSVPARTGGTLTVFSLYHSETVDAAVNAVKKQYGVDVSYTYAIEESVEDGQFTPQGGREDAITQLNTELLAGGGPDVIVLDEMPVDSMVDKGVLMDLSGLADTGDMLTNLAGYWQRDGGMYAVSARCIPLLLGGDKQTLDSIPDAETLARQLASGPDLSEDSLYYGSDNPPVLAYRNTVQVFDTFYPVYAGSIWQDGRLNEEAYRSFVQMMADIVAGSGKNLKISTDFDHPDGTYYHPQNGTDGCFMNYGTRAFCSTQFDLGAQGSKFHYHALATGTEDSGELKALQSASGQTSLRPSCTVGINASAANPEQAAQFVAALLSEDVQRQSTVDGMPVLKTVIRDKWQSSLEEYGTTSNTDLAAVLEEMDVVQNSAVLRSAAGKGVQTVLDGGTMDQAVRAAADGAALWLAEQ